MEIAEVITWWEVAGNRNVMHLPNAFSVETCSDATGQSALELIGNPNLLIVSVIADTATMDAIEADQAYGSGSILWREDYNVPG